MTTTPNQAPEAPTTPQFPPSTEKAAWIMSNGRQIGKTAEQLRRLLDHFFASGKERLQIEVLEGDLLKERSEHAARISDLEKQLAEAEIRVAEKDSEIKEMKVKYGGGIIQIAMNGTVYEILEETEQRLAVAEDVILAARCIRAAQIAYMNNRGNTELGAEVGKMAARLDEEINRYAKIRGEG